MRTAMKQRQVEGYDVLYMILSHGDRIEIALQDICFKGTGLEADLTTTEECGIIKLLYNIEDTLEEV